MSKVKTTHLLADFIADCLHEEMAGQPEEAMPNSTWEALWLENSIEVFQEEGSPSQVFITVNGEAYQVSVTRDTRRDVQ